MNVDDLKKLGGIITRPPVEMKKVWTHTDPETGETHNDEVVFHVKVMTIEDHQQMMRAIRKGCEEIPAMIVAGIRLDGGKQKLTHKEAGDLEDGLAELLAEAVDEVNELGKKYLKRAKKLSTPSSSQESAGEQSKKPSKT